MLGMFFFYISLWLIDVSTSAMLSKGVMTNLYFNALSPNITYHLGLVLNMCSTVGLVSYFTLSNNVFDSEDTKNSNEH